MKREMIPETVRTCINNWKAVKRGMINLATKQSTLPNPDRVQVFGWHMSEEDKVVFYYDATCGASDKQELGVVLCDLEYLI